MMTYNYKCKGGAEMTVDKSIKEADREGLCLACGDEMTKVITGGAGFSLTGGNWPGKAIKAGK